MFPSAVHVFACTSILRARLYMQLTACDCLFDIGFALFALTSASHYLDIGFAFILTSASHSLWHRLRRIVLTSASRSSWHRLRIIQKTWHRLRIIWNSLWHRLCRGILTSASHSSWHRLRIIWKLYWNNTKSSKKIMPTWPPKSFQKLSKSLPKPLPNLYNTICRVLWKKYQNYIKKPLQNRSKNLSKSNPKNH